MSIPGTHDSGTSSLFGVTDKGAAHCQNFNIIQQLNDGIRFLDIRIGLDLRLNHGGTLSNYTWDAAAESLNSKMKGFRSELRGIRDLPFFLYRCTMIFNMTASYAMEAASGISMPLAAPTCE